MHNADPLQLPPHHQQTLRLAAEYQQARWFPEAGITTTVEGLWIGVPSVTLRGDRFLSHQRESILNNAGLPDWIAEDEDG
jgi:predicted O-linked N-acetylglucosamine transferase (SPINDLY family)